MRVHKLLMLVMIGLICAGGARAQFSVNIEVTAQYPEVKTRIADGLRGMLSGIDDVTVSQTGKYRIEVRALRRLRQDSGFDYFFAVNVTSAARCVVEMDGGGRVISTTPCSEHIASSAFAGRENEIDAMLNELVRYFDSFVIGPLRTLKKR